jgi:hypothetical protein
MPVKLAFILLIFISVSALAEEDCIFNETAYTDFINKYVAENSNAKIEPDGKTLIVKRKNEEIAVKGGGCVHLGVAIDVNTRQTFNQEQFLHKVLGLANEFGSWLINTRALENSIKQGKYSKIDGDYYIEVNAMTVFSASYDNKGKIIVDFYIN